MEEFGSKFLDTFIQTIKEESSHIIECAQGKKKWLFYFVNGQLSLTKSNLKQEQTKTLQKEHPDATAVEISLLQAKIRFAKCVLCESVNIKTSSKTLNENISTMDALIGGLSGFLSENTEVMELLANEMDNLRPNNSSPIDTNNAQWQNFMATLKGSLRSSASITSFGLELSEGWALLWTLQTFELLEKDEEEEENLSNLLDFNLDELLAEEVAKEDIIPHEPESAEEKEEEDDNAIDDIELDVTSTQELKSLDELEVHITNASNHFEILGVSHNGTLEDFRRSYFDLSKKLHPDRFSDADESTINRATILFDKVREAHETLANDDARAKYIDTVILGNASEEEQAMQQLQAMWKAEEAFKTGERLFQQGQIGRAHDFFQEAHENDENTLVFKAYFGYTTFHQNKTRPEDAQAGLDMILEVTQLNEDQEIKLDSAWVLLARAYRESGKKDRALRAITKALKIKPSNSDAQRELKRIRGQEGKPRAKATKKEDKKGGFFSRLFGGK